MKSFFLLCVLSASCLASTPLHISSPNGRIGIEFRLEREGVPEWKVAGPGGVILTWSPLGLTFLKGNPLTSHFTMADSAILERDETYELVIGKTKKARDHFRELRVQIFDEHIRFLSDSSLPGK